MFFKTKFIICFAFSLSLPLMSLAAVVNITRNAGGFTPSSVTITVGDQIKWINASGVDIQPSSNPHPEHNNYSALNMSVIADSASSTSAVLNSVGTWGYHDHLDSAKEGVIIIQAASSPPVATGGYRIVIPPPSIVNFIVNEITTSTALIGWRTDYYSYTKLKYGTSSSVYSNEFSSDLKQSRFEHSALLTNLAVDTNYYFIFVTGRPWLYTETVTSTEKIFKTLAELKAEPKIQQPVQAPITEVKKSENDAKSEISASLENHQDMRSSQGIGMAEIKAREKKIIALQIELLETLKKMLKIWLSLLPVI